MKNKKLAIISLIIIYIILFVVVGIFTLKPAINKLKMGNEITIYSSLEMPKKITEIENQAIGKKNNITNLYSPMKEEINNNFKTKEEETNTKYSNLENEIKAKYETERKKLNSEKNDLSVKVTQEFFAHGLSKQYYTLRDEETEMFKKINNLDLNEKEEIRTNETNKRKEISELEKTMDLSIKEIETKEKKEIQVINNETNKQINLIKNASQIKKSYIKDFIKYLIMGIFILLIPVIYIVIVYNKLIKALNTVKEKWSQVDVFLKQRMDLIPNIVNSVKGYTKHEKETLKNVTEARTKAMNASTKEEEINANKLLDKSINKIILLKEAYPELKADHNFINLQNNLKQIEENIAFSRQIYNKAVLRYKNKIEMFPSNIIASLFNFKQELFFEIDDNDSENVKVQF